MQGCKSRLWIPSRDENAIDDQLKTQPACSCLSHQSKLAGDAQVKVRRRVRKTRPVTVDG